MENQMDKNMEGNWDEGWPLGTTEMHGHYKWI